MTSIKLTAIDMDGALLSGQKIYNREWFMAQCQQMKTQGVRFTVVGGNQYYQLISPFPEIANEVAFMAENGGWVMNEGGDVFNGELSKDVFATVVEHLLARPEVEIIACGKNSAYALKRHDDAMKTVTGTHCHRLEYINNLDNLEGISFKFDLNLSDELIPQMQKTLHGATSDIMVSVYTGNGSTDLTIPGVHKANSLRQLQKLWGIDDSEVVILGDDGNDIEVLRQTDSSFTMENAGSAVVAVAKYRVGSSNHGGILDVIDKVLKHKAPFKQ